jgi:hypothetical protein
MSDANLDFVPTTKTSSYEADARAKIGRYIMYFALVFIGLLGMVAIAVAIFVSNELKERFNYVKDVLTIILPLVGTWVGTILAFYFSRENYAAAAHQTANLIRQLTPEQRLQGISVSEVMIDMSASTTTKLVLNSLEDAANKKLKDDILGAILDKSGRGRLPILDKDGCVRYIVHRSYVDKFIVKQEPLTSVTVTLKELLEDVEMKAAFQSFTTVARDAKLFAVKQAMDRDSNCADVFVTEDGGKESRAIGWITNAIVLENSVA